ncbi:MAG: hypothetical protein NZ929_05130 [Aigarchaeota archaeon]|nr:hypothetical protein [Aigarchaeota archaeon]MCX8192655.1 hypothetical protein [Nitrososphaeria archaeon]MDW7985615.1 hypothetical protein [Nitrososphaerota archaeon]
MEEFLDKKTLVLGEVGTGKTTFLIRFLEFLIENSYSRDVTVIDMAPSKNYGVGGAIVEYTDIVLNVKYLRPSNIWPPRLLGRDKIEVLKYSEENVKNLEPLIEEFISNPTKILLINDLTIYLHAGDIEKIFKVIDLSRTFMATAYEGVKLEDDKGSSITEKERRLLNMLKKRVDNIVKF